jgi:hypothetical protein
VDFRSIPAPSESSAPSISVTPTLAVKTAACVSLSCIGLYYLATGKKEMSLQKMILGGLLILGSLLVF